MIRLRQRTATEPQVGLHTMGSHYRAEVHIEKQEDGLWRVAVPGLQGAWVDAPSLEEAYSRVQEVIALAVDYYQEHGWPLPGTVTVEDGPPRKAVLVVIPDEHQISLPKRARASRTG